MIDVSQSVEHDHPHASEFLRKDCMNVVDFFSKRLSRKIFTLKKLYDFIVLDSLGIKNILETESRLDLELVDTYFDLEHEKLENEVLDSNNDQVCEEVFKQIYIPRSLNELPDVEKVFQKINLNNSLEVIIFHLIKDCI